MSDIHGVSLIIGNGIKYLGSYKRGVWFDNCEVQDIPKEQRIGYGIKLDICFSRTIRPIGMLWKKEYWNNEKLRIMDIPEDQWDDFFGVHLAGKLRQLKQIDATRLKHGIWNPWYCRRWFTLRLPKYIPFILPIFISVGIGTKWSGYFGNKVYQIDPFTRDCVWANADDKARAIKKQPGDSYFALAPSATSRPNRMT